MGAGELCGTHSEAAPVVAGVLVEVGKPTGGASTGWRWRRLVERFEVLGMGWLPCGLGGGWCFGGLDRGLGIQLKWRNESGDI